AAELDGVGIGTRGTRGTANLYGNLLILGSFLQGFEDTRIDIGTAKDDWPAPQPGIADLLLIIAGRIRGMRDIDGDPDCRMNAVRARRGTAQADLFLYRRNAVDRRLQRSAVQEPEGLHHGPDANLVIQTGSGNQVVAQLPIVELQRHRIAQRHERL